MEYLTNQVHTYDMLRFPDHHIFKIDDLTEIKDQFKKLTASNNIILTTEKDAVRLEKFKDQLASFPFYVLPITRHRFLFNEAAKFENTIINTIKSFQTKEKDCLLNVKKFKKREIMDEWRAIAASMNYFRR